jgi:hypothetical protein
MKITKARLKEIIQEELEKATPSLEEIGGGVDTQTSLKDAWDHVDAAIQLASAHPMRAASPEGFIDHLKRTRHAIANALQSLGGTSPEEEIPRNTNRGIPHSDDEEPHAQRERRYDRRRYGR